jgi:polysaccharide deacetylase family sporulation protein PdaB
LFIKLISILLLSLLAIPAEQASAAAKSQLISKVSTTSKVIALTFDDGSDGENIQKILQILNENEVKATFFLTGSAAKSHPKLVKSLLDSCNAIGNHSYSHPYFTKLTTKEIKSELSKAEKVIKNISNQTTKPFFRPPYGDYNSSVLQAVGNAGYSQTITWTIDTLDWKGISASKIVEKVLSKASPGSIVLMHAGAGAVHTPDALPDIIQGLKEMGYQFVTIPELLDTIPSDENQYIVKAGDTLLKISKMYGVTVQQLASANGIENPNNISEGQVLIIPDSKPAVNQYTVKKGDTLTKISKKYKVTVKQLADTNHITNINLIYPEQVLIIPS